MESRTAISRRRASDRASNRLAALAQAMTKISPGQPEQGVQGWNKPASQVGQALSKRLEEEVLLAE